jgi:hypothetical protein
MLLRELIKYTPNEHMDHKNLVDALQHIEEIASLLDIKKKEVENVDTVFRILNSIDGTTPLVCAWFIVAAAAAAVVVACLTSEWLCAELGPKPQIHS